MPKILWLDPDNGYSEIARKSLDQFCRNNGLNPSVAFHYSLRKKVGAPLLYYRTKVKQALVPDLIEKAIQELDKLVESNNPKVIVINDLAVLWLITGNENYSLNLCRGSVYFYKNIPCIIIDNMQTQYAVKHGKWVMANDLQKIGRWYNDKQRKACKFTYRVCHKFVDVVDFHSYMRDFVAISIDIETKSDFITCISYTCLINGGELKTWVVPFLNTSKPNNCHWYNDAEEIAVWQMLREIHLCEAIKIFQNGAYDCSYLIKYRCPVINYFVDSAHLMHSIWAQAPKKLGFIASLFLDYMRYWKDDIKGDDEEKFPTTTSGLERFWRYNALDTYNTFYCSIGLLATILNDNMRWALSNYNVEFKLQIGPCLFASMHGLLVDYNRQRIVYETNMAAHQGALQKLRIMCDDHAFNPSSPYEVAQLIYDVLGAQPIQQRGNRSDLARSTDEKVLETIAFEQNPIFSLYINAIWDTKKPLANASKYGKMRTINNRFLYSLSASGTWTGRLSSSKHAFWIGTNAQNVPTEIRCMCVADQGYVLIEVDYSQSDAKFVAFESEDLNYIATMESGKDTHSLHAAHFFKRSYEEVYQAAKNKEPWCVHPTKGIRQNTKRAVHGCNFQMSGYTLIIGSMKKEGAVAAMTALGFPEAAKLGLKGLAKMVDKYLIDAYHQLYTGLRPWFKATANLCVKQGNKLTCAFGKTVLFFGNVLDDQEIQRAISSFYGQGGTGGNINRSMLRMYYNDRSFFVEQDCTIVLQVHDSLIFQVPWNNVPRVVPRIKEIMEEKFEIKGRTLHVGTDIKIGLAWGESMIEYHPAITMKQLEQADRIAYSKLAK